MAFTFRKIGRKLGKIIVEQINRWGWIVLPDKFTAKYLRRYKFEITTFIDVGVGKGTSSLYELFHNRQIVMIDPFPGIAERCASSLRNPRFSIQLLNFAAGEREMEMDLNLSKGASSFFKRDGAWKKSVEGTVRVKVERLDDIVAKYALRGPFGLKIDTEGFELNVIRGAGETLQKTEFVIAEVSLKERFVGGYTFSEFVGEMAKCGFEVADVIGFRGHSKYVDVMFVPKKSMNLRIG